MHGGVRMEGAQESAAQEVNGEQGTEADEEDPGLQVEGADEGDGSKDQAAGIDVAEPAQADENAGASQAEESHRRNASRGDKQRAEGSLQQERVAQEKSGRDARTQRQFGTRKQRGARTGSAKAGREGEPRRVPLARRTPPEGGEEEGEGHSPERRQQHSKRGGTWSPSPERRRHHETSKGKGRRMHDLPTQQWARAEEWGGPRERRREAEWSRQEGESLVYGAERAWEASEGMQRARERGAESSRPGGASESWGEGRGGAARAPQVEVPARFSGDQRARPTLKNYLMQVGNVRYRCDGHNVDPVDFFLSLPNTLEGEAETLYRMRMEELLWRAGKYGEDPTEAFLERLQRQFPGHTADRIREFQEFRRGRAESLLTYNNRLINVAEDVKCADNSLLISKFLGGLDEALGGGGVYELGAEAALEEVFELAEKVELAQRKYEAYLPRPTERSRRPTWAAAMIPEERERADTRAEMRADTRTCHRRGQVGHLHKDCKNCDGCGKPGHRKRECPDASRCEICGKKGHDAKECYQREGGVRRNPEELQRQISRLQSQLQAMGPRWEAEAGMYARDDEGEEVEPDAQCALMAWRGREEMGLRSGGRDGRQEYGRKERERGHKPDPMAQEKPPARHPQERLACQTSVLLVGAGAMEVEGKQVKTAIIDTGEQSVTLGKGMAEWLGLMAPERQVAKSMLVMTAEGGESKWMPCTRTPIELTLLPGGEHETRIRIKCGISESEDFYVLVGTEMVFAVGMSICTWTEKVEFRTRYWKKEGPLGQLPVQFVKVEPKRAYQASAREASERQQTGGQVGREEIRGGPRMKLMDAP
ncbi:unnamed protein product [Closterium sp. NIES-54]